jgi:hypothetical protein
MFKILKKITALTKQEATKAELNATRKMIVFIVIFLLWSICVTVLKF